MTAVHVARFGNKASAHDVLEHSGIPKDVLTTMVWRTDTPPNSEGLGLEPFVAAYRSGDYYVLHATSIDADAPRAGMVATTAAIVPLCDVAALDIRALWTALADGVDVDRPLNSVDFMLDSAAEHIHPAGSKAAASGLLDTKRVVWTGPGFEDFVECLWLHLRAQNRGHLVVAAAGHPDRIPIPSEDDSLTVVKSSASAIGRWSGWVTAAQTAVEEADVVRDALFGDDEGRAEQLAERLDLAPAQVPFPMWRHLANAANFFQNLSSLNHGQARALLQLLGLVQPEVNAGSGVKREALDRLRDLTSDAEFADIRGLRGIPWGSLDADARQPSVEAWAKAVATDPARAGDVLIAGGEVVAGASDVFMTEVGAALAAELRDEDVARLCGRALESEVGPGFLTWLVAGVRPRAVVDAALSSALQAGTAIPGWLAGVANGLRLPMTLAASIPVDDAVVAWRTQISLGSRSVKAEDLLEMRTGPRGVVQAALALDDTKLLDRASRAVAADSGLLSGGSIDDTAFRALWFAAAKAGADPWAVARPSNAVGPLLDMLLAGEFVEPVVLSSLSHTTAADISAHGSRRDIWSKFPPEALQGFMEATAQSVARSFQRGDAALEHQLARAVLAGPLLGAVARESAGQALELLAGITSARAADAVVVATHGRFSDAESTSFGDLVKHRNWRSAADAIINLSASRSDLVNAATVVSGMFGLFDRLARIISAGSPVPLAVSTDELRSSVTTVAATLYKNGPMTDALWERAGGDEADLVTGRTGRLAWGQAIEASLAGRRGAPTLKDLVAVMLDDYPNNPQLHALKQTIENGTST